MPIKDLASSKDLLRRIRFWARRKQELQGKFCNCPSINKPELKKILALFLKYYVPTGYFSGKFPENREKFRKVHGDLYEIKSYQIRLLGFFNEADFIIVLCVRKKKNDLNQQDIDKALKNIEECKKEIGYGKGT
ncbi:MAG: type II toxin-antitoxin system RelE/ParE family toxin [Desulfohalobiaceae bacterium]|nr:type II toxin-antitoxin system RelE/ParE family toxin [Desulfohalobiaceae bacterium]